MFEIQQSYVEHRIVDMSMVWIVEHHCMKGSVRKSLNLEVRRGTHRNVCMYAWEICCKSVPTV